jgi:TPR repeat protein
MASLTPLSKGLIAVVIVGGMASAVWHLGLKDWMKARDGATPVTSNAPPVAVPEQPTPPAAQPAPITVSRAPAPMPTPPAEPPPPVATPSAAPTLSAAANAEAGRKLLEAGNAKEARPRLEQAVQDGDGSAACLLGDMTLKGQGGLAASQEKAAALFQLAQSRGSICFGGKL